MIRNFTLKNHNNDICSGKRYLVHLMWRFILSIISKYNIPNKVSFNFNKLKKTFDKMLKGATIFCDECSSKWKYGSEFDEMHNFLSYINLIEKLK